jgi:hypothetical protein
MFGLEIAKELPAGGTKMLVAGGLAILVVFCLLLSVVQTPPEIGR